MRSRKAIAVLLAGAILLGACSTEDEEWTDDDRGPLIARCETVMPDEYLDIDPDACELLVWMLEEFGCTLDDAAGAAADEELLAAFPLISGEAYRKYPSCEPGISSLAVAAPATSGSMQVAVDTTLTEGHNGRVVIAANGVTLDCAGYTITGVGLAASTPGIAVTGRTGVTIKNCTVEGFKQDGINVHSSNGNTFSNNTINGIRQGFVFHNSDSNELTGNAVTGASDWFGYGIFEGSDNNVLRANSATAVSGVGFMIQDADNNAFVNNDASGNYGNGFGANAPAVGNTYTGNTATNNSNHDFEDNTSGGRGDAGTDNNYSDNVCDGRSSPVGLCNDIQLQLDATAARGVFAETPWMPGDLKDITDAVIGCDTIPDSLDAALGR